MASPQSTPVQLPLFVLDKRCNTCGLIKPLEGFSRSRKRRDGKQPCCKECDRARALAYFYEHRDQQMASGRAWKAANAERIRAYNREHAAERAAYVRKSYRKRRAYVLAYAQRYGMRTKERRNARLRERYRLNPLPIRMYVRRRAVRKRAATGTHTLAEWLALKELYGQRCLACGATHVPLTEDHIVPITRGGSDNIVNIQPLCRPCNSKKHNKTIDYRPHAVAPLKDGLEV